MVAEGFFAPSAPMLPGGAGSRMAVLAPALSGAAAFSELLGETLIHIRSTLDGAAAGNVEGIHQLRVGVRRARAMLALFKPLLIASSAARFDDRLRDAGHVFGAARDWDVFATETLPRAGKDGVPTADIEMLTDAAVGPRAKAHAGLQRHLEGGQFPALLAALGAWVGDGQLSPTLLGGDELLSPIEVTGRTMLKRVHRRMVRRAKGLRHAPTADLHRLRKSVKTFRYAADGIGPIYPAKPVKAAIKASKKLQEMLGAVNDAAAIAGLTHDAGMDETPALAPALTALRTWAEERSARHREDVPKAWHALRDRAVFW